MRPEPPVTPNELADALQISPKTLRVWLRRTFPRSPAERYQRWELGWLEIQAARQHFA